VWRRAERVCLGVVFGIAAWIIERRVLKAIRKRGLTPPARSTIGEQSTSEFGRPSA
jgi:hypothetical protein